MLMSNHSESIRRPMMNDKQGYNKTLQLISMDYERIIAILSPGPHLITDMGTGQASYFIASLFYKNLTQGNTVFNPRSSYF